MREILVTTSAYVSTDSGEGGGEGKSQGNPTKEGQCHLFLAGNRAVLFRRPAFFLAVNHMTIVAFEKRFL